MTETGPVTGDKPTDNRPPNYPKADGDGRPGDPMLPPTAPGRSTP